MPPVPVAERAQPEPQTNVPVVFVPLASPENGNPVAFVRVPEAGVPSAGVVKVGAVSVRPAIVVVVVPAAMEVVPSVIGNPLLPPEHKAFATVQMSEESTMLPTARKLGVTPVGTPVRHVTTPGPVHVFPENSLARLVPSKSYPTERTVPVIAVTALLEKVLPMQDDAAKMALDVALVVLASEKVFPEKTLPVVALQPSIIPGVA